MTVEIVKVPDLGGAGGVEVIEIAVAVGDEIAVEDTLLVLESDKATMDVPSPVAGVVRKILVKLGDSVSQEFPIVEIEVAGTAETAAEPVVAAPVAVPQPEQPAAKPSTATEAKVATTIAQKPVMLPDLGTDQAVDVIELAVAIGDEVAEGDPLMTLEGDKATMDVPSPFAGKVVALSVAVGDKVKSGQQVVVLEVASQAAASAEPERPVELPLQPAMPVQAAAAQTPANVSDPRTETPSPTTLNQPEAPLGAVYAGPVVRQFARELGIDLRNVKGSGVKGRIQREDVQAYVKQALQQMESAPGATPVAAAVGSGIPAIPDQDFSQFGEVEEIPLSKIARLTATNMRRTWLNVPAVTQFDDADITDMESFRKSMQAEAEKRGVKLTPVAFLMKACAAMLKENPVINRSWHSSGDKVIQKHYVHIGMAVATPSGLLVPVIRDVDKKGIFDIARDIAELAEKARVGKLSPAEMQGGCFSISSLGNIGGRGFTPIVNAPEAAILGVSKAAIQPVWNGKEFLPRQLLPLSLSYDHKLVNGADAGKFLTDLVAVLGDVRRLLL